MFRIVKNVILPVLAGTVLMQACAKKPVPEESCHFVQNSFQQRVSWKDRTPIVFYAHTSFPTQFLPELEEAMQIWNDAGVEDFFVFGGWVTGGERPVQDRANVVYWLLEWDKKPSLQEGVEQARTRIHWVNDQIVEADIQINAGDFRYSAGGEAAFGLVDMKSLLVHELGHALGLAHIGEHYEGTVMAHKLPSATLRHQPQKVDLDSLACEYKIK